MYTDRLYCTKIMSWEDSVINITENDDLYNYKIQQNNNWEVSRS